MKKALLLFIFVMTAPIVFAQSDQAASNSEVSEENIVINGDFSDELNGWEPFLADWEGVSADIAVTGGEASITNIAGAGGDTWHLQLNQEFTSDQIEALETGYNYMIQFDARSDVDGRQLRMFFGEDGGAFVPINITDVELTTDMVTYEAEFTVNQTFGSMKLGFEMGLSNDDVFIDNVSLVQTGEASAAPPAPEGFVAENNIAGDPVGPGEAFLAAGPNNVEEADIEYRLFYSITADAPGDPTEASEYDFGTTAGDGGGVAAFGFTMTDLEDATDYTFWLYQYNTAEELFSDPAVATVVSGGDGDDTPVGDNIVFNGDFSDGLESWEPFIADWEGVSADFDVVDGEAAITNIAGAGGQVWFVQFNQLFTDLQIQALETGNAYKIEFDARSDVDGRQLRMFFGQDGGAFTPVHVEDVELTTDMETYEVLFNLNETFGSMKLGFEMGLTNDDVYLDNVSLMQTDETVPVTPPMPDGFVVSDMIGENPVGDGEIFVAAGPNQVAEEDLVYRLFYSITADAPENPQDATEHQFGSIPGDGEGIGPFGFVVDELEPGTEYTFWLYQYNTAFELFSDPASGSAVSGGESGEPAPDVNFPVTFEDDIDWDAVFTNFDGGSTTVIDNPDQNGINESDRVAQMVKGAGEEWGGSYFDLAEPVDINEGPLDIQVWAPRDNTTLLFKLENSSNPDENTEINQDIPVSGEWTELSFDFSGADPDATFDRIVLIFDLGTVGDGSADFTWFFDNIDYGQFTSTDDGMTEFPKEFKLSQNYPNPFNPTTQIQYSLPEAGHVTLNVYDITGRQVAALVNESVTAGSHTVTFDASMLASGIYLYRLQAGNNVFTRKMMLVK